MVTKSKSSTRDILYVTIDTFLDVLVKKNFPLLSTGWHQFRLVSGNRYLSRGSNETVADPGGAEGAMAPPQPCTNNIKKMAAKCGHIDFMFFDPSPPGRWIRFCELYITSIGNVLIICCQMVNTFGNHTTSGFCHESLNSAKSI